MILCKIGMKYKKICNGLRDPFKWLVMQKTFWVVLNARKSEIVIAQYASGAQSESIRK